MRMSGLGKALSLLLIATLLGQVAAPALAESSSGGSRKLSGQALLDAQAQFLNQRYDVFKKTCIDPTDGTVMDKDFTDSADRTVYSCLNEYESLKSEMAAVAKRQAQLDAANALKAGCTVENVSDSAFAKTHQLKEQLDGILDKAPACKQDPNDTLGKAVQCRLLRTSLDVISNLSGASVVLDMNELKAKQSEASGCKTTGANDDCLLQIVREFVKGLWSSVTGTWDTVKGVGSKIASFVGLGETQTAEDKMEVKALASSTQSESWIKKFINDPVGYVTSHVQSIFAKMRDDMVHKFACEKYDGLKCVKTSTNWSCASGDQKLNAICGALGSLGGEAAGFVATSYLTAGVGAVGSTALSALKESSMFAKFTAALPKIADTAKVVEGVRAAEATGELSAVGTVALAAAKIATHPKVATLIENGKKLLSLTVKGVEKGAAVAVGAKNLATRIPLVGKALDSYLGLIEKAATLGLEHGNLVADAAGLSGYVKARQALALLDSADALDAKAATLTGQDAADATAAAKQLRTEAAKLEKGVSDSDMKLAQKPAEPNPTDTPAAVAKTDPAGPPEEWVGQSVSVTRPGGGQGSLTIKSADENSVTLSYQDSSGQVIQSKMSRAAYDNMNASAGLTDAQRAAKAREIVGEADYTPQLEQAIQDAHRVGTGPIYSPEEIQKKAQILVKEGGLKPGDPRIRQLQENWVTGDPVLFGNSDSIAAQGNLITQGVREDNRYVSVVTSTGTRFPARVLEVNKDTGAMVAEVMYTSEGSATARMEIRNLTGSELQTMRKSAGSQRVFKDVQASNLSDGNRYISINDASGKPVPAKIIQINSDVDTGVHSYVAQVVDAQTGKITTRQLTQREVDSMQVVPKARDYIDGGKRMGAAREAQEAQIARQAQEEQMRQARARAAQAKSDEDRFQAAVSAQSAAKREAASVGLPEASWGSVSEANQNISKLGARIRGAASLSDQQAQALLDVADNYSINLRPLQSRYQYVERDGLARAADELSSSRDALIKKMNDQQLEQAKARILRENPDFESRPDNVLFGDKQMSQRLTYDEIRVEQGKRAGARSESDFSRLGLSKPQSENAYRAQKDAERFYQRVTSKGPLSPEEQQAALRVSEDHAASLRKLLDDRSPGSYDNAKYVKEARDELSYAQKNIARQMSEESLAQAESQLLERNPKFKSLSFSEAEALKGKELDDYTLYANLRRESAQKASEKGIVPADSELAGTNIPSIYHENRQYQWLKDSQGNKYPIRELDYVRDASGRPAIRAAVRNPMTGKEEIRVLDRDEMAQANYAAPLTKKDYLAFKGKREIESAENARLTAMEGAVNKEAQALGVNGRYAETTYALSDNMRNLEKRASGPLSGDQKAAALRLSENYSQGLQQAKIKGGNAAADASDLARRIDRFQSDLISRMSFSEASAFRATLGDGVVDRTLAGKLDSHIADMSKAEARSERALAIQQERTTQQMSVRNAPGAPEAAKVLTDSQKTELNDVMRIMQKTPATLTDEDVARITQLRQTLKEKRFWAASDHPYDPRGLTAEDQVLADKFDSQYLRLKRNQGSDSYDLAERQQRTIQPPTVSVNQRGRVTVDLVHTGGARSARESREIIDNELKTASPGFSTRRFSEIGEFHAVVSSSQKMDQIQAALEGIAKNHKEDLRLFTDRGTLNELNGLTTIDAMQVDQVAESFSKAQKFVKLLRQTPGLLDEVRNLNNYELNRLLETIEFQVDRYVPSAVRNLPDNPY